ncbi:hypothetical protein [Niallia sp. 03133]|uniref:hypothetical protein n=1 Tax=Niallia sp. 03133 TaxID=3458060 RepID=UPI004044BB40
MYKKRGVINQIFVGIYSYTFFLQKLTIKPIMKGRMDPVVAIKPFVLSVFMMKHDWGEYFLLGKENWLLKTSAAKVTLNRFNFIEHLPNSNLCK